MYSDWVILLLGGVAVIWLLVLSFQTWKQSKFLESLLPRSGERDIRKKFEDLIKAVSAFKLSLGNLEEKISGIERDGLGHLQRVSLVRFNPYDDTGGDQSFSIALLDKFGNGLVMTSLHSRSGTRVFAKPVKGGKPEKYQFSKEEEEIVKDATDK